MIGPKYLLENSRAEPIKVVIEPFCCVYIIEPKGKIEIIGGEIEIDEFCIDFYDDVVIVSGLNSWEAVMCNGKVLEPFFE